jgi:hypothetical protein
MSNFCEPSLYPAYILQHTPGFLNGHPSHLLCDIIHKPYDNPHDILYSKRLMDGG